MEKPKATAGKNPGAPAVSSAKAPPTTPAPAPIPALPPLFRRIDWLTFGLTTLLVFVGYLLTLAPEMTLEDSGELATGSFYAGVPHPPGYPVWTIYTWFWTVLLPFKNVAWRVAVGEAFSGALACGLLAFMVSRGSSMFMEGIAALKEIDRRLEGAICVVSGFVAGTLLGFNGFMWSQSVIVEVYAFGLLSLMGTLCSLMRWVYSPRQRRYLYLAFFLFGICFTNHQTLILAAMGLEVAVIAVDLRVGRDILFGNSVLFAVLFFGTVSDLHLTKLNGDPGLWLIFRGVGGASVAGWIALTGLTRKKAEDWIAFARDVLFLWCTAYLVGLLAFATELLPPLDSHSPSFLLIHFCGVIGLGIFSWLVWFRKPENATVRLRVHLPILVLVGLFVLFLIPLSADYFKFVKGSLWSFWAWMTPGILIALVYFCLTGNRTDIKVIYVLGLMWVLGAGFYLYMPLAGMSCPPMQWGYPRTLEGFIHALTRGQYENAHPTDILKDPKRFIDLVGIVIQGVGHEFNAVYALIAVVPFFFILRMQKRERAWLIGLAAVYLFMAILLAIMLNPTHDRQSIELNRVFFTASHAIIAMFVGYGVALIAATMLTHYDQFRLWGLIGGGIAICFGLYELAERTQEFYGDHPGVNPLKVFLQGMVNAFHKDQYALPVYANMLLLAMVLVFLGNLVFSRLKPHMPVVLTVFALMPTYAILCNWFDNEQRGHWFGYWFGHDMFTPPFVGPDKKFGWYDVKFREDAAKGPDGALVYPEMTRDAILFGGTDPGRFAPTYMIFCDSFIKDKCKPVFDQNFNRRDVYIITQNALADGTYLEYIRSHYFRSDQYKYDTPFFLDLLRMKTEKSQNYSTNFLAALAYEVLDQPLTKLGARIEKRRRDDRVYPPREIYEPTPRDSEQCFGEYTADAERRMQHDEQFPGEPKQIKPGEYITRINDGGMMRIQVSGQTAVMSINALLTKVIFDHNPTNEFFVEESFPLDWMYPYLTPFGIIMKINRQPLPEITDDICRRDHEFWSKYSERFIGNWITYETSVKEIADFAEKVYLRHDFSDFKGDRKFGRDDQAQKAFSKLRSSIAGVYAWRLGMSGSPTPPEYLSKSDAERKRMLREADFSFKQSFAFCPYSPEAVFRYINLLANPRVGRYADALIVAQTCLKLDPNNGQVAGLVQTLKGLIGQTNPEAAQVQSQIQQWESDLRTNPNDFQKSFDLAQLYMRFQQVDRVVEILDGIVRNTNAPPAAVMGVAQAYVGMRNIAKLEPALERYTQLAPTEPEAWYNLAATKAMLGKNAEALQYLRQSLDLSAKRLLVVTNSHDLRAAAEKDERFNALRATPEYKALMEISAGRFNFPGQARGRNPFSLRKHITVARSPAID